MIQSALINTAYRSNLIDRHLLRRASQGLGLEDSTTKPKPNEGIKLLLKVDRHLPRVKCFELPVFFASSVTSPAAFFAHQKRLDFQVLADALVVHLHAECHLP